MAIPVSMMTEGGPQDQNTGRGGGERGEGGEDRGGEGRERERGGEGEREGRMCKTRYIRMYH